jgi:hypothetical protein
MNYMTKVDAWLNELLAEGLDDVEAFKKAIKDKILESYRNGQRSSRRGRDESSSHEE